MSNKNRWVRKPSTLKGRFCYKQVTMFDPGPCPRAQYRELLDLMEAYGLKGSATVGAIARTATNESSVWVLAPSEVDHWLDRLVDQKRLVGFIVPKREAREAMFRYMDTRGRLATYAPFEFWMLAYTHHIIHEFSPGFAISFGEAYDLLYMSSEVLALYGFGACSTGCSTGGV